MPPGHDHFSLLGGPLYRLGVRLGLVRGGTNTIPLGLAIGAFLWLVLVALILVEGLGKKVLSLEIVAAHVRLLVAIPLFFVCETAFDPRCAVFVREIVLAEVVPATALPELDAAIARAARWTNAWLPEAIGLLVAVLLLQVGPYLLLPGVKALYSSNPAANGPMLSGQWYGPVCLTTFRFLLFRWLWRLANWGYFLWRVSRLPLRLVPTHPDGAGGLGFLEIVHTEFAPLVLAISAVQCSSYAGEIALGVMRFEEVYPALALMLVIDAVLFIGPLTVFAPKLWAARMMGMSDYMVLGSRYVSEFESKWLGTRAVPAEPLLGSPDVQSLADLTSSIDVVRGMRLIPMSRRMLLILAMAAGIPYLPLLLLKYPITELVTKFFGRLTGL